MPVPLGYTYLKPGQTVVLELPGHAIGEILKADVDKANGAWALVRIGARDTWFPGSLLFVIPPHWETTGVRR